MSQSTSLSDRIATAHKATEEIAPWIQRDVQQALELLRRSEEIALPSAHRHEAVIRRLDKQEKYITKLLQLVARGGMGGGGGGGQQQMSMEQQHAMMAQNRQQQELAATQAGLASTRSDHPTGHPQILPGGGGHPERSQAMVVALQQGGQEVQATRVASRRAGGGAAGGRGEAGDMADYERQMRQLEQDKDYPSP